MADSDGESLYEGKEYIPMNEKLDKWADVEPGKLEAPISCTDNQSC